MGFRDQHILTGRQYGWKFPNYHGYDIIFDGNRLVHFNLQRMTPVLVRIKSQAEVTCLPLPLPGESAAFLLQPCPAGLTRILACHAGQGSLRLEVRSSSSSPKKLSSKPEGRWDFTRKVSWVFVGKEFSFFEILFLFLVKDISSQNYLLSE